MKGSEILIKKTAFPLVPILLLMLSGCSGTVAEHSAVYPVPRDKPSWGLRQEAMNTRVQEGNVGLLWIGDSIAEGWEEDGKAVWDRYYAHRDAVNLGISGDRTEHVLWRLDNSRLEGLSPALAIVMIGQNNGPHNSAEEIAEGITAIVERLRIRLPDMKVLLLGVFYRGAEADEEWEKLRCVNGTIAQLADNAFVYYRDVNHYFQNDEGKILQQLMPDYEHPNEEGYALWAAAMEGIVSRLMGDDPVED
jgi:lysophospholipase L1-like esterase